MPSVSRDWVTEYPLYPEHLVIIIIVNKWPSSRKREASNLYKSHSFLKAMLSLLLFPPILCWKIGINLYPDNLRCLYYIGQQYTVYEVHKHLQIVSNEKLNTLSEVILVHI